MKKVCDMISFLIQYVKKFQKRRIKWEKGSNDVTRIKFMVIISANRINLYILYDINNCNCGDQRGMEEE